jgi:glycosyltransferase involved in cell wall biosynthesis
MKKKLIIHNGNISIGGQEKMLIEFLRLLSPAKYEVLLLIEEDNGKRNDYINDIPSWIEYRFLTTERFMESLEKNRKSKNPIRKIIYSLQLKRKKIIAINELKKYLNYSNIIIDYDMGLIRNLHRIDLKDKILIGWSHAGEGAPLKSKQKRENLEKYNYIVAINERMKEGYEKNTKKPKIVKIYNFMDFSKILELSREEMDYDLDDYIISVGSLTENKNHKLLIESFYKLKKEEKNKEKLIILGEGKERENLEKLIKKLNLEKEVLLLGQKKNPYNYILNSKLFVLPSKNEGMPLTLLEALSLGKMIIATRNNGSNEILNSKYGVLVENDINELTNNIYYYLINVDERKYYEKLTQERIKDFEKNKIKRIVEEFIDNL